MAVLDPEKAIRKLIVDAAIVSTRVYPQSAPQSAALPRIVYTRISGAHAHHMTAASGWAEARIQLDVYAANYTSVKAAAESLRVLLDTYRGTVTIGADSVDIDVRLDNDRDGFDSPGDGSDAGGHRVIQDYIVWFNESIP